MCNKCFNQEFFSFQSEQDYNTFDLLLTQKLQLDNGLKYVGKKNRDKISTFDIYQCLNCSTIWWLSTPDYAWRGFFLKEVNGKLHLEKITHDDKIKGYGCVVIILIIAIIIILNVI